MKRELYDFLIPPDTPTGGEIYLFAAAHAHEFSVDAWVEE